MDALGRLYKQIQCIWVVVARYCTSTSFTLHFSFSTVIVLVIVLGCLIYNAIRGKYLKNYSKLPQESPRKEYKFEPDLFPDNTDTDSKPGIHNYLDEFLSAIKVFGYLERPVFHELTRHLQTRKLLAGETLNLEDEKSFCLVVDGHVQVFFRTEKESQGDLDDECGSGYRLLTDVRNGRISVASTV